VYAKQQNVENQVDKNKTNFQYERRYPDIISVEIQGTERLQLNGRRQPFTYHNLKKSKKGRCKTLSWPFSKRRAFLSNFNDEIR